MLSFGSFVLITAFVHRLVLSGRFWRRRVGWVMQGTMGEANFR